MDTEVRAKAMALRLSGRSYAAIGVALGISRQRAQQIISPPPEIRRMVKTKADDKCQLCGIHVPSGHVHHRSITDKGFDDYNDLENLVWLCVSCHGQQHDGSPMSLTLLFPAVGLSNREVQVLRLVAQGMTNAEVARVLGISIHTVRTYMRGISAVLNMHNRTAISAWAWRTGIVTK